MRLLLVPFRDGCNSVTRSRGIDSRALARAPSLASLVAGAKRRLVGQRPVTLLEEFGHFVEWRAFARRRIEAQPETLSSFPKSPP